ncbi:glycosyltransferase family 2 protein [Hirschia baltica]|uniref:Glycosyl transferase family 2 n=1 Tax=Hirschia baltica (strain ATCC 49814 / DSM 5838 / IFAM 1418) TaxID=582402 RepID=C6XLW4_HIRBI|nr:glycosyltransferase family 2 protein [Hirschia baltica]ACT59796.1 glycosyl transferase family 2 [Hirschia baltica ATCC 49814]
MTHPIDVSVIIAAWNAQDYIQDAIESALSQQNVSLEVIVVDDASPDETYETVQKLALKDARIRVFKLDVNGGPSKARNKAIEMAKGRFIAVLDSDDAFLPDRLDKLVQVGDQENADIIVDNMMRVNAAGQKIDTGNFLENAEYQERHIIGLEQYVSSNIMMSGAAALGYLKPLFRATSLEKLDVSYDETLRNSEDYYLVTDLLVGGAKMVYDPFVGYAYQVEEGSISHRLTSELTAKLVDAAQRFDVRQAGKLSKAEEKAVKRYRLRLEHTHVFQQIVECLKMKHFIGVLRVLLPNMDAFPFVLGQFWGILKEKISIAK